MRRGEKFLRASRGLFGRWLQRPRTDAFTNGRARDYELYPSEDENFGPPTTRGTLPDEGATQTLKLPAPVKARYLRFVIFHDQPGYDFGSLAEITIVPAD